MPFNSWTSITKIKDALRDANEKYLHFTRIMIDTFPENTFYQEIKKKNM